ncbi:hypothetical protein BDN70DRAFT_937915 [Pholiota conissans]|uniref:Uncharacterized protein n=1 Tax=Pholiota conissans TaxID=109636 RepID=A0A9P5YSD3_9AGAR|nr:hypothetical protein BDN70DRAFT_937915 [Pholiota conissans]
MSRFPDRGLDNNLRSPDYWITTWLAAGKAESLNTLGIQASWHNRTRCWATGNTTPLPRHVTFELIVFNVPHTASSRSNLQSDKHNRDLRVACLRHPEESITSAPAASSARGQAQSTGELSETPISLAGSTGSCYATSVPKAPVA